MDRVLLVEDDKEIARIIRYYLSQDNLYDVVWANTSQQALVLSRDDFDIILLDVCLPDQNGIELCGQLRQWHDCPILFISCLDDSNTIISALQQGGDDYIVKPFDNSILHARIQANLRRFRMDHQAMPINELSCDAFTLDARQHRLVTKEETYDLVPIEFKLLSFLMQHPKQCFKASELYNHIWGKSSLGDDRTVVVHIHNLRKKIEPDLTSFCYIKSVWGKGYTFDPDGRNETSERKKESESDD